MIPKLMGAVRLNAPNNLEYCQVPVKEPDEYEVLCKVESLHDALPISPILSMGNTRVFGQKNSL